MKARDDIYLYDWNNICIAMAPVFLDQGCSVGDPQRNLAILSISES